LSKISGLSLNEDFYANRWHLSFLYFFFLGVIAYSSIYIIKGRFILSQRMGDVLQFGVTLGLLFFAASIIKFKIKNQYLKPIFSIYLLWSITVILRGISLNPKDLIPLLLDGNYGILLYFAPLVLLFPKSLTFYKRLFDAIILLGVVFLLFTFLYRHDLTDRSKETQDSIEYLSKILALPCGFILLTYKYHSKTRILFALLVMSIAVLFSIYKARRGLSFILMSNLFLAYFLYILNTRKKVLAIYLSVLVLISGALYATSIYNINNNKLLNMMADRAEDDSRTGVELYFYNDMNTKDWIIGRGVNGEYYCPIFSPDEVTSDYRNLIETGYLQIILKGGLIRLILFLLIAIPAIFLGLFSSKNLLAKASAFLIAIGIMSLYPATVESFNMQYILFWISIGVCYSSQIRSIPDNRIQEEFNKMMSLGSMVRRIRIL